MIMTISYDNHFFLTRPGCGEMGENAPHLALYRLVDLQRSLHRKYSSLRRGRQYPPSSFLEEPICLLIPPATIEAARRSSNLHDGQIGKLHSLFAEQPERAAHGPREDEAGNSNPEGGV